MCCSEAEAAGKNLADVVDRACGMARLPDDSDAYAKAEAELMWRNDRGDLPRSSPCSMRRRVLLSPIENMLSPLKDRTRAPRFFL
jgi:hypothetical protein